MVLIFTSLLKYVLKVVAVFSGFSITLLIFIHLIQFFTVRRDYKVLFFCLNGIDKTHRNFARNAARMNTFFKWEKIWTYFDKKKKMNSLLNTNSLKMMDHNDIEKLTDRSLLTDIMES